MSLIYMTLRLTAVKRGTVILMVCVSDTRGHSRRSEMTHTDTHSRRLTNESSVM